MDHTAHFTLEVEKGCPEGHEIVFEGEGDESPDWEPGDVVLRVRSRKNQGGFKRKEASLYWTETIGIDEVSGLIVVLRMPSLDQAPPQALLGFEHKLTHFDGHNITLSRKDVTQPGTPNSLPVRAGANPLSNRLRRRDQGRRHANVRK